MEVRPECVNSPEPFLRGADEIARKVAIALSSIVGG
jgi:hypothetical protein